MRRLALILAILLVAVVAGTVHVHTQDEDEQGYVESLVQRLLSAEGRPVTVQGIGIGFTGNVTAERVAVRDEAGEWLVIEDFGLDWRPLSLFTDTLVINALTAERMTMLRRPEAAPPAEAPDEAANLIAAEIGTLSIGELEIAAAVAGTPARFTLSGSGSLSAAPAEIRLDLTAERIDEVEGRLAADIVFEQETSNLDLSLVLAEGRGGLVQQLLALEGEPTVDLRVNGHGPVSDWSGDLRLALDGEELVSGTARLSGTDAGTMIEAQLAGEFTRLVPSEFHDLVQGRAELAAAVMLEEAGALRIESAILRSDVVEISADGGLDFETGEMLFSLTGQLGYAGPVEIAEAEILRLAFEARLQGTYDAPEWDMNASAESLIAAGVAGRNLTLEISGAGLPIADQAAEARIIASGELEPGDSGLPPLLAGQFLTDLSFDMPGDGRIVLENAYVETPAGAVSATGHVTPETGSYELALDAQMRSPETGIAALDQLLQGQTRLVGRTTGIFPDVVRLHDVALTSDVLAARLGGEILPETMDLTASAVIEELARLDARAAGTVELEATLTGPRDAPQADVSGRGREVVLMDKPFRDVVFEAAAMLDPDQPTAAMRLTGTSTTSRSTSPPPLPTPTAPAPTSTLPPPWAPRASRARWRSPPKARRAAGSSSPPPTCRTSGRCCSPSSAARSTPRSRSLKAREGERSTATIDAQGRDITLGALAAASVDADLVVEDLFGTPRPRGDMRLAGVRAGGVELAAVELETEAVGPGRFAIALEASGPRMSFHRPDHDRSRRRGLPRHPRAAFGRLDGNDLSLVAPAAIRFADDSIRIERAEIAAGGGRVIVAGSLSPALEASIEVSDLQLAMAGDLVPDVAPTGVVSGTLALSGSLEAPQARFVLTGSDVSVAALRDYGLPPLALEVQGDFAGQDLTFLSTARGPARPPNWRSAARCRSASLPGST
jgi:translocation and assembly module TamB